MVDKKKRTRAQLDAAMDKVHALYGRRSNFTGADVGYRYDGGKRSKTVCVRVHVDRKLPLEHVAKRDVFPAEIDGVPLDVIQGPYRPTRSTRSFDHQERFRMVLGGISCGRIGDGTGTIGAVVIDERTGRPAILSNWHVLAGANARRGDRVLQPGGIDGGLPGDDEIAVLERWMLGPGGDAAIALLNGARSWLPVQFGSFDAPEKARDSRLGEILVKAGRTTGQTRAMVDGEGIYRLHYEVAPGIVEVRDVRGFKLVPEKDGNPDNAELSAAGDSGALWHHLFSKEAVGLHFAGEAAADPAAEHAIACNLTAVLDKLDVRLATFDDLLRLGPVPGEPLSGRPDLQQLFGLTPSPKGAAGWPDWPWPLSAWPFPAPRPMAGPPNLYHPGPWSMEHRAPAPFAERWGARAEDSGEAATAGTGLQIRRDVLAEFEALYASQGNSYMSLTPRAIYQGFINSWRTEYRGEIEQDLQRSQRYPIWLGLDDPSLTALFDRTLDTAYAATVTSIGAAMGIDPWDD